MLRLQPKRQPQPHRGVLRHGAAAPDGTRRAERLRGHQPQKEAGKIDKITCLKRNAPVPSASSTKFLS